MNIEVRDMDGLSPADLADECGHEDCALFLRSPSQVHCNLSLSSVFMHWSFTDKKSATARHGLSDIKQ